MRHFVRLTLTALFIASLLLAPASVSQAAAPAGTAVAAAPTGGQTCTIFQPGPAAALDSYIKQEKPDEQRGTDSELRVRNQNNKLKRALLQFDLSSLPSGAVIDSATLSLYVKDASGGPLTINAHEVTASWNETQVTWKARDKAANLLWTTQGGDYNPAIAASTSVDDTKNVWRSWDLTGLAAGWASNPASNYGVILEASGTPNKEKVFKSSDDGTASQRPKLEVCYSAGLTLTPNNSGDGVPGLTRTYAHVLTIGDITSAIDLSAVSNRGWTVFIYEDENGNGLRDPEDDPITQTPVIGPQADYPILVQVTVPVGVVLGTVDVTTVTATAQSGGASATATDTTTVGGLLSVQPDHSMYAVAGTTLFYGHTVTNNGDVQDCVTITAASSQGWSLQLWEDTNHNGVHETSNPNEPALSNPVCIDPGQSYYLVAELTVPGSAAEGVVDQTVITATSANQPNNQDSAVDTTTVFVNDPPVIDGKYDDVYRISPDSNEVCYTSNGVLFGKLATFYQQSGDVYVVLAIDKDFVDNTYGANAVGWPSGHTFNQLVGSDHAQFLGYDSTGANVLDFKIDFISTKSGTPSGYATLGLSGDGKMNTGNAAHILEYGTSLDYNLNSLGYCSGGNCSAGGTNLLVNSPATDQFYTPNPAYPDWIFETIYEVKISSAAFPGGFDSIEIPYIHASHSKLGVNSIYAEPGVCPGEIGDFVWHDLDHDGIQDPGEPGIDGVQVKLYQDNGDGVFDPNSDAVVGSQTTSAGGKYLFQNLPPNDYFVDVVDNTVPSGLVITTNNDPTAIINLGEGQSYLEADFGYARPADFGDLPDTGPGTGPGNYRTLASDGGPRHTIGSLFLGALVDAEGDGQPNATATGDDINGVPDDEDGVTIPSLMAGQTAIVVVNSSGAGKLNAFFDWNNDGDFDDAGETLPELSVVAGNNNLSVPVPLDAVTGANLGARFRISHNGGLGPDFVPTSPEGEVPEGEVEDYLVTIVGLAAIGDYVWEDLNGNGLQDEPASAGINGVTVELYQANGTFVANTVTADDGSGNPGYYLFEELLPGDYYLVFSKPGGYEFTIRGATGIKDTNDSDPDPASGQTETFSLAPGETDRSWDAGLYRPVRVGDFAWIDTNGDGIYQSSSELPLNGVIIQVTDSNGAIVGTAETGPAGGFALGEYLVEGLPPGVYTATVVSWPTGYLPTQGTVRTSVPLSSGQSDLTLDFPFINTTGVAVVSFQAQRLNGATTLRWTTASEADNAGFTVWRASSATGPWTQISAPLPSLAAGNGGASYQWSDMTVQAGESYWYQLRADPSGQVIGPVQETLGSRLFLPIMSRD